MSASTSAPSTLDREYLEFRARLIDLAAMLDRVDRGEGSVDDDSRMQLLLGGIELLATVKQGRAEQMQKHFSLPYDPDWQDKSSG